MSAAVRPAVDTCFSVSSTLGFHEGGSYYSSTPCAHASTARHCASWPAGCRKNHGSGWPTRPSTRCWQWLLLGELGMSALRDRRSTFRLALWVVGMMEALELPKTTYKGNSWQENSQHMKKEELKIPPKGVDWNVPKARPTHSISVTRGNKFPIFGYATCNQKEI